MSHEPNEGSSRSWFGHFRPRPEMANARPSRLPYIRASRDGDELRSPVPRPAQEEAVIDLTEEPETPPQPTLPRGSESRTSNPGRLPRFGRDILENIVDLEADEDEPPSNPTGGTSSSPEVQFVGSTTRRHPLPSRGLDPFSAHRSNLAPPNPRRRPMNASLDDSMFSSIFSSVPGLLGRRNLGRFPPPEVESLIFGSDLLPESLDDLGQLNYSMSSFPMGAPTQQAPPSRRNEYKPPSPAPEGFTRTLGDDDVAVCPNCYWELGTGEGKKQEIWVSKQCGHVCWPLILQTVFFYTDSSSTGLLWRMHRQPIFIES